MKERITTQTIILHREGKRIKVPPGVKVELTDGELDDLRRMSPDAVRTIKNEVDTVKKLDLPKPSKSDSKSSKVDADASDEL